MTDTSEWSTALYRLWCNPSERRRFEREHELGPILTGAEMALRAGDQDTDFALFWDEVARHYRAYYMDLWRPWAEAMLDAV